MPARRVGSGARTVGRAGSTAAAMVAAMPAPRRPAASRQRADAPPEDRSTCTACRGTGQVISGLGGTPSTVSCPWCGGSGKFQAGSDAQVAHQSHGSAEA
jgi:hypothetical protein